MKLETKGNILLVDDTVANLQVLVKMLSQQGYTVRPAQSGARALAAIRRGLPDLILLDIKMPEMTGYEVCQQLKAHAETQDIPIIFISALDETFDKVTAFAIGGVDYITKPFQEAEVLARVRTHLALQEMQQGLKQKNSQLQQAREELEEKVEERTIELFVANQSLQTEVAQRKLQQQEKDRLLEVVGQQSEQLRSLTNWLIETQAHERQGLSISLNQEIQQTITLVQSNINALQTILSANQEPLIITYFENIQHLLEKLGQQIAQVNTTLDQASANAQDLGANPLLKLTFREREVLQLIADGKSSNKIAEILSLAPRTVHTYNSRIKQKLNIQDSTALVKFALEHNLFQ